jgi:hypothetical protein
MSAATSVRRMTYAEWFQTVRKPQLDAITPDQRRHNTATHTIGTVDDCARCTRCEIAAWNSWQQPCTAAK